MDLSKLRITIMGLGLHGGGAAAARFCVTCGADVTVTDLRDTETLRSSIESLSDLNIRFVLGEHRREDFTGCDMVVKNPAVPRDAPMLILAAEHNVSIETDISLFLKALHSIEEKLSNAGSAIRAQIAAVTGTKGKSSTTTALHHALKRSGVDVFMGGNITISPLLFIDDLHKSLEHYAALMKTTPGTTPTVSFHRRSPWVVLELSSFQIGDLEMLKHSIESGADFPLHWPDWGILTNIFVDHQDYYGDMNSYVADKLALFSNMAASSWSVIGNAGDWTGLFLKNCGGQVIEGSADSEHSSSLLPRKLSIPGSHQRENLSLAALLLEKAGFSREEIPGLLDDFSGVEHRLQFLGRLRLPGNAGECKIYNDSAATIPEACLAAVEAFQSSVFLICGGSNKGLDPAPIISALKSTEQGFLLKGSGTEHILGVIEKEDSDTITPRPVTYDSMQQAIDAAVEAIHIHARNYPHRSSVLLLSPGCASFGMFLNEFDRGRQFIEAVKKLPEFIPVA